MIGQMSVGHFVFSFFSAGSNVHMNHIDHGISIEMIKNERDFNFVFENLFESSPVSFSSSTPLSHSQSVNDSMNMSSSLTTLNPVVHSSTMSSLLLSPSSMIETLPSSLSSMSSSSSDEIVSSSSPAPFDSDKENYLRLPCFLVTSRVESEPEPAQIAVNPEANFTANPEKPAVDTRRTRNMPSRDQVTGRFKNSNSTSTDSITVLENSNSHQSMMIGSSTGSTDSSVTMATKPSSRKSSKRSRSIVNNPNRRKRTKFTHEQV